MLSIFGLTKKNLSKILLRLAEELDPGCFDRSYAEKFLQFMSIVEGGHGEDVRDSLLGYLHIMAMGQTGALGVKDPLVSDLAFLDLQTNMLIAELEARGLITVTERKPAEEARQGCTALTHPRGLPYLLNKIPKA